MDTLLWDAVLNQNVFRKHIRRIVSLLRTKTPYLEIEIISSLYCFKCFMCILLRAFLTMILLLGDHDHIFPTEVIDIHLFIQARISRGAGEVTEPGLPKMSQLRGLPLAWYIKILWIIILFLSIILVFKYSWSNWNVFKHKETITVTVWLCQWQVHRQGSDY